MFRRDGPSLFELARQALSSTERGYDLLAPKFDATPFRTPEPVVIAIAECVGEVRSALDVCCGTGAALFHLAGHCTERAVGIDMSAGMLAIAAERLRDSRARVDFVRGDALDMPFDSEFDAAVCVGAFGHIEVDDEPRFVRSIHHALATGGRFVFATTETPPWTSPSRVMAETFNAIMRVRNAVWSPAFVMYYLTFMWPNVRSRLLAAGFRDVEVVRGAIGAPYERVLIVVATK